uniref:Transmembrane protein n=1 Tax=Sipha flava TaxID=143950 RepID=A0A2S2QMB5_9HEMI
MVRFDKTRIYFNYYSVSYGYAFIPLSLYIYIYICMYLAITLDMLNYEFTCLSLNPIDVLQSIVCELILMNLFIYFNYKLLLATEEENLQSIFNWMLFHSSHLAYITLYIITNGLIKRSPQYLAMGAFTIIIYFSSILMVRRFYEKELIRHKRNIHVTLRVEYPAVQRTN